MNPITISGDTVVIAGTAFVLAAGVLGFLWKIFGRSRDIDDLKAKLDILVDPKDPKKGTIPELTAQVDDVCDRVNKVFAKQDMHEALDLAFQNEIRTAVGLVTKKMDELNDSVRAMLLRMQRSSTTKPSDSGT